MYETKFMGKSLYIDSQDDFKITNAIFSVEFDFSHKAILLRASNDTILHAALNHFCNSVLYGTYGPEIKRDLELSDSLTVDIVTVFAGGTFGGQSYTRVLNIFLQKTLVSKIIELCTYAPYGYNIEVGQVGYKDDDVVRKMLEKELINKPNGQHKLDIMYEYLNIGIHERRRKGAIVYSYDITDGHFVEQFESITSAAEAMHCSHTAIINACDGRALTACSFAWSRHKYEQLPAFIGNEKEAAKLYAGKRGSNRGKYVYKFDAVTGWLVEEYDTIQDAARRNKVWPAEIADACKAGLRNPIIINGKYIFTEENLNNDRIEPISLEELRNVDKNNVIRRRQLREQKKHEAFTKRQEKQAEEYSKKSNKERVYKKERVYHRYPKKS